MLNKVTLIGLLGKDPETKFFGSGDQQTSVSMATSERWKDRETGERREKTSWHNLVFNSGLAKVAAEYLKKGSKIFVEGKIDYQQWEQDGVKKYMTRIVVSNMIMLDNKGSSDNSTAATPQASSTQSRPSRTSNAPPPKAAQSFDDFDDDIPY